MKWYIDRLEELKNTKPVYSVCGDDCAVCPRYLAKTDEELHATAEFWYRAGWRDHVVTNDEIRCTGCGCRPSCSFMLLPCTREHHVSWCKECSEFECEKVKDTFVRSAAKMEQCRQACESEEEFQMFVRAFYEKEKNMRTVPMRIGVIVASSQANKGSLLYDIVRQEVPDAQVMRFGCYMDAYLYDGQKALPNDSRKYSYIEISVLVGLLLGSGAVDLVVTGCSSGQGMMLACNNMPGVLCGYIPTPMDAYLFAQINDGNCVSVPLGEEYTWSGKKNLEKTIRKLFSEPFGQGYPKSEAERKLNDTKLLKEIRKKSQVSLIELLDSLDPELIRNVLTKKDVIEFILKNGKEETLLAWIDKKISERK